MKDRIEITYEALDLMIERHGKHRPDVFGGGVWDAEEEFEIYKKQVGEIYSPLQWIIITSYFNSKFQKKADEHS